MGSIQFNGVIVGGTFAAQFGYKFAAGLTLKFLQLGSQCTGSCDLPPFPPRTAAIDFGVRYFLTKDSLIAIGASGLNLGLPLQVNDSPQADPLPHRAVIGVAVTPKFSQLPKEAHVRGEVDMIKAMSRWRTRLSVRGRDRVDGSVLSARRLSAERRAIRFWSDVRRWLRHWEAPCRLCPDFHGRGRRKREADVSFAPLRFLMRDCHALFAVALIAASRLSAQPTSVVPRAAAWYDTAATSRYAGQCLGAFRRASRTTRRSHPRSFPAADS